MPRIVKADMRDAGHAPGDFRELIGKGSARLPRAVVLSSQPSDNFGEF
jgi:hypothetical protein